MYNFLLIFLFYYYKSQNIFPLTILILSSTLCAAAKQHCMLFTANKNRSQIANLSLNMINFSFTVVKLKEKSRKQKRRFFNSYLWTVRISANVAFRGRTRFKIEQVFIVSSLKQKHLKVLVQMQRVKIKLSLRVSHTKQSSDWIRSGLKVFVL